MLKTTFEGMELIHRHLWVIVEEEARRAGESEQGWFNHSLVAMVFALHTVEAYLNFVGEQLAPEIWLDEQNYFRKEPYRGWNGKLRKVMKLVGLAWSPEDRPLKTILDLKELRDLIAHGKSERLVGEIVHAPDTMSPFPVSTLRSLVAPKEKLTWILHDVEQFLNQIHVLAAREVNDAWFGTEALRGPMSYSSGQTQLVSVAR
jgi:hypothetical protein